jgi:hypothetical protein
MKEVAPLLGGAADEAKLQQAGVSREGHRGENARQNGVFLRMGRIIQGCVPDRN